MLAPIAWLDGVLGAAAARVVGEPLGLVLTGSAAAVRCQRHVSAHMASMPSRASQPSAARASVVSA